MVYVMFNIHTHPGVTRTHLCDAKAQTRRQQGEQQLYPRAHVAAQPRASSTDRAFMGARGSLLSSAVRAAEQRLLSVSLALVPAPFTCAADIRRYERSSFRKPTPPRRMAPSFSSFVTYNLLF